MKYPTFFSKLWTAVYPLNKAFQDARPGGNYVSDDLLHFIFRQKKFVIAKHSDRKVSFLLFLLGFGGVRAKRTSKSASSWFFAPGTPILRSETPQNTSDTHTNTNIFYSKVLMWRHVKTLFLDAAAAGAAAGAAPGAAAAAASAAASGFTTTSVVVASTQAAPAATPSVVE